MSKILVAVLASAFVLTAAGATEDAPKAAADAPTAAPAARTPAHKRPALLPGVGSPSASKALVNAGFEAAGAGPFKIPGWTLSQHAGVRAFEMDVDKTTFAEGHASFRMRRTQPQVYGTISQTVDASALAGKKVELRVRVKVDGVGKKGWSVFLDSSGNHASKEVSGSADWKEVVVTLQLPKSAKAVTVGAMLLDAGSAWLDDVRLDAL